MKKEQAPAMTQEQINAAWERAKAKAAAAEAKANRKTKRKAAAAKPTPEAVQKLASVKGAKNGKDKVASGFNAAKYGENMAREYDQAIGAAGATWQQGIAYLLEHCSDVQRDAAMSGVMVYVKAIAKETGSDFRTLALRKRVSEARRVFKAAAGEMGTAKVLETLTGKGTWHQKIASLPKATTKGAKKGARTAETKGGKEPEKAPQRIAAVKVGDVIHMAQQLKPADVVLLVDRLAFGLTQSKDISHQSLGKKIMEFRDAQEHAQLRKVA